MIEHHAKNLYINLTAILSTVGLSVMQLLQFLDGVLPTVSLLLTTISVAILIYYNIRIKSLEIKKLKKDLDSE